MFVRLGMEEDVEAIVEMGRINADLTRTGLVYDEGLVRKSYQKYLDDGNPVFYMAEHQRQVVGFLLATVCDFRFASGQYGIQEVLFVRPEHRGTRAAVLLMKHFIAEADRQGLVEIMGGNDNGFQSERTKRFLEHLGFETVGYSMRRLHGRQKRR